MRRGPQWRKRLAGSALPVHRASVADVPGSTWHPQGWREMLPFTNLARPSPAGRAGAGEAGGGRVEGCSSAARPRCPPFLSCPRSRCLRARRAPQAPALPSAPDLTPFVTPPLPRDSGSVLPPADLSSRNDGRGPCLQMRRETTSPGGFWGSPRCCFQTW